LTIPQRQFKAIVTNNENQTYFSCSAWIAFVQRYGLTPQEKLILWLDEGDKNIIFYKVNPDDYMSSVG
jgi:hypothetical protein